MDTSYDFSELNENLGTGLGSRGSEQGGSEAHWIKLEQSGLAKEDRRITVDISLDWNSPHQPFGPSENGGHRTTFFVQKCLEAYPYLRELIIILKLYIAHRELNLTYFGTFL
jgi:hypothetical protein